jgi:hypothetical protein
MAPPPLQPTEVLGTLQFLVHFLLQWARRKRPTMLAMTTACSIASIARNCCLFHVLRCRSKQVRISGQLLPFVVHSHSSTCRLLNRCSDVPRATVYRPAHRPAHLQFSFGESILCKCECRSRSSIHCHIHNVYTDNSSSLECVILASAVMHASLISEPFCQVRVQGSELSCSQCTAEGIPEDANFRRGTERSQAIV